jgi:putative membrane protein
MRFVIHWLVVAVSLWVAANLVTGIHFSSTSNLLLAALVLGLVNALVRPVLFILTLPITVVTLGLFYLVVNGAAFALTAALVRGFTVTSFTSAVLGALVVSVVSWILGSITG